jgi:hypothetical protein
VRQRAMTHDVVKMGDNTYQTSAVASVVLALKWTTLWQWPNRPGPKTSLKEGTGTPVGDADGRRPGHFETVEYPESRP